MWHQTSDKNYCIRELLTDYSKAFYHVEHSMVLRKRAALDIHLHPHRRHASGNLARSVCPSHTH